jgi:hypothetical protein
VTADGNYWIDWSEPLSPKIKRVDHTMADPPRSFTFNEAKDEIGERLYSNVLHIHRKLDELRSMRAKDVPRVIPGEGS